MNDITDTDQRYQVKSRQKSTKDTATGRKGVEGTSRAADSGKLSRRQAYDVGRDRSQKNSGQQEVDAASNQGIQPGAEIDSGNPLVNSRVDKGQKKDQNSWNHQQYKEPRIGRFAG